MFFPNKVPQRRYFANNCCNFATIVVLLFLFVSNSEAQEFNMNAMPPPDAAMHYSVGALSEKSNVTIDIVIPDNWHVNANVVADEFLKPSSVEISAPGIEFGEVVWPEPIKEYNEVLEFENLVFKGHFQIKIPVKAASKNCDSLSTKAIFHYQACDNSICLAPAQVEIALGGATGLKKNDEGNGPQGLNGSAGDAPELSGVAVNDGFQHIDKDFGVGHAEKIQHLLSGDGFAALADINDLIEKAQGVAHGMIASGGDKA